MYVYSESPHIYRELVWDSPKVNVLCGLMKARITGPFFFMESTITGDVYFDMLEQFVYPQVADLQLGIIYQHDPPIHTGVCVFENPSMTLSWTAGLGATDQSLGCCICQVSLLWIYFYGGMSWTKCKPAVCLPFQRYEPVSVMWLPQLSRLFGSWQESEYRPDIIHATNELHVEVY
jgi:hypothetical protein